MEKIIIISALCIISAYGLLKQILKLRYYNEKHKFALQYLENLKKYWDSSGRDTEIYGWLIHRSNKMQEQMGDQGIIHNYRPPYQNFMIRNYPIILNIPSDLRGALEDEFSSELAYQYVKILQESIVRHIGSIEDIIESIRQDTKNPIKWFRDGIRDIVLFPVYLLGWLGLISEATARKWVYSIISSVLSGIIALASLGSAIITIIIGWEQFLNKLKYIIS